MKKYLIISLVVVGLAVFGGIQSYQLVKAKQLVNQNTEQLQTELAISSFKIQYGQVLDQILVQGIDTAQATIIYWTETVTTENKTTLHASAIINGAVLEFPKTQDVTPYLGVK